MESVLETLLFLWVCLGFIIASFVLLFDGHENINPNKRILFYILIGPLGVLLVLYISGLSNLIIKSIDWFTSAEEELEEKKCINKR